MLRAPHTQESTCLHSAGPLSHPSQHRPAKCQWIQKPKKKMKKGPTASPSTAVSCPASAPQLRSATCQPGGAEGNWRTSYKLRPISTFHRPYFNTGFLQKLSTQALAAFCNLPSLTLPLPSVSDSALHVLLSSASFFLSFFFLILLLLLFPSSSPLQFAQHFTV